MFALIGRFYPKPIQKKFKELLHYCNIETHADSYLAGAFTVSLGVALIIGLLIKIVFDFSFFLFFLILFLLVHFIMYAWLSLTADAKARFVENLLPDMLQLMASNLRAGYTIDRALLLSARPEFGEFQEEINRVGKEVATGRDFNDSLSGLGTRVKSAKLQKTIQLVNAGQQSGGELADLLEESAANLRHQKIIDERIRSNVLIYVIFIFSAIGFGSPVLFGLSSFLIDVITDLFSSIEIPDTASASLNVPLSFSQVSIDPGFVLQYTIISMIVTSIMGSLVIGLISRGKEKEGLRYIPILLMITIPLFFLVKFLIGTLLSGLFNI